MSFSCYRIPSGNEGFKEALLFGVEGFHVEAYELLCLGFGGDGRVGHFAFISYVKQDAAILMRPSCIISMAVPMMRLISTGEWKDPPCVATQ